MNINKSFTSLLTAIAEDQNKSFMDILQEDGKVQDVSTYDDKFKASVDISNCFSNYMYFLSKLDELSINITSFAALSKVRPKIINGKAPSIALVASPYGVENSKIFLGFALYLAMFENKKVLIQDIDSLKIIKKLYNSLPDHLKIKSFESLDFIFISVYKTSLEENHNYDSHIDFFIYDRCQELKPEDYQVFIDIPGVYNADGGDLRTAKEAINDNIKNNISRQGQLQIVLVKYTAYEMHMSKEAIQRIVDTCDNNAELISQRLNMEY